jgi:membrane-associated phospholipid phosphatase
MIEVSPALRKAAALALAIWVASISAETHAGTRAERVEWSPQWRRVRPWEYATTAATLGVGFYLRFGTEHPSADWRGGILFDDALLDEVAIDGTENRLLLARTTDGLFYSAMAYRLVDSMFVPSLGYGSTDVALQMSMIDLQAFGIVAAALWSTQALVGRERPVVTRRCGDPAFAATESKCDPDSAERNRSLIAGHPAVGITAAGLTCLHHAHLPLYGADGDRLACGMMIGAAAINGLGRVMTEQHYASDLVLGTVLGITAGYLVPSALHYGFGSSNRHAAAARSRPRSKPRSTATMIPLAGQREIGAALVGSF